MFGKYVQEEVRNQADMVWFVINALDGVSSLLALRAWAKVSRRPLWMLRCGRGI